MMTISTAFKRDLSESSPVLYITTIEEFINILKQGIFVFLINFGNWFSLINNEMQKTPVYLFLTS